MGTWARAFRSFLSWAFWASCAFATGTMLSGCAGREATVDTPHTWQTVDLRELGPFVLDPNQHRDLQATFEVPNPFGSKCIARIKRVSCSCLSFNLRPKVLAPGETATLELQFRITGDSGFTQQSAVVEVQAGTERLEKRCIVRTVAFPRLELVGIHGPLTQQRFVPGGTVPIELRLYYTLDETIPKSKPWIEAPWADWEFYGPAAVVAAFTEWRERPVHYQAWRGRLTVKLSAADLHPGQRCRLRFGYGPWMDEQSIRLSIGKLAKLTPRSITVVAGQDDESRRRVIIHAVRPVRVLMLSASEGWLSFDCPTADQYQATHRMTLRLRSVPRGVHTATITVQDAAGNSDNLRLRIRARLDTARSRTRHRPDGSDPE